MPSSATVVFSSKTYGLEAIKKAAYRFSHLAAVDIVPQGDEIICTLTFHRPVAADDEQQAINDFKVEVLDQDLRSTIAQETTPIRNAILAHAFSKTGLQDSE